MLKFVYNEWCKETKKITIKEWFIVVFLVFFCNSIIVNIFTADDLNASKTFMRHTLELPIKIPIILTIIYLFVVILIYRAIRKCIKY